MDRPVRSVDDLLELFQSSCTTNQLLGVESEKFGVATETGKPVAYEDACGCDVLQFFDALRNDHGWKPLSERPGGPILALERVGAGGRMAQITLEPGGQFELSGEALATVHDIDREIGEHLAEIAPTGQRCGVTWLATGYHPIARQDELPWVPKDRYAIMREYFPAKGTRGVDMMRRTATVQVNCDFTSEEDAMRKLRLALKLAPVATAIFANSPLVEGKISGKKCERAAVWLDTDPDRTGLLPQLWRETTGFRDYVEWALDVPMYLFKRDGKVFANTGQTFRSFWRDGFEGERPTISDWKTHLATLFPEARLKQTLEMRSVDSLPRRFFCALPALWAGLLYDARALAEAEEIVRPYGHEQLARARQDIVARGLEADLDGAPLRAIAERVVGIALAGLARRACLHEGRDESRFLEPIARLVQSGRSPADELLAGVHSAELDLRRAIIACARADC
jgi:glutamate--cysteine ligase